jgi:ParB family chromosome partitioning protein
MPKFSLRAQVEERTGTKDSVAEEWRTKLIPLGDIKWVSNIRANTDAANIEALAESIRNEGLKQPVGIYLENGEYCLLYGHRRYKAFSLLNKENPDKYNKIPCIITEKGNALINQLVENIQREGLTDEDNYNALKALRDQGLSQEEIAVIVGKSVSSVNNTFAALNDVAAHAELRALLQTPAGGSLQAIAETAGIKNITERVNLINQKLAGEINREELREKKRALQKGSKTKTTKPTPAGGSCKLPKVSLNISKNKYKIEISLIDKDAESFQKLSKKIETFIKKERFSLVAGE